MQCGSSKLSFLLILFSGICEIRVNERRFVTLSNHHGSTVLKLIWHLPRALASVITTLGHVVKNLDNLPSMRLLVNCDQIPSSFRFTTLGYLFHLKLKYSHIHFKFTNTQTFYKWFTSRVSFSFYTWTLTAKKWCPFVYCYVVTDHICRKWRANDTNQIMNLYKWNTQTHIHTHTQNNIYIISRQNYNI